MNIIIYTKCVSYATTQQLAPLYKMARFWLSQEQDDALLAS
jgi:hypothetical protein